VSYKGESEMQGDNNRWGRLLLMYLFMAFAGVMVVSKALELGYSLATGILTVVGLYAFYATAWLMKRYMLPR